TGIQLSAGGSISSTANVTLTGTSSTVVEADTSSFVQAALLTTGSAGGTALGGANTVSSFNATNTTGGNVSLTNTATTLAITGITQSGTAGGADGTLRQNGGASGTRGVSRAAPANGREKPS